MTEPLRGHDLPGRTLAARREELQMTLAQVAGSLLLSQRHVEALEADDPAAFYNHTFYEQARRRYAVLLGLVLAPDEPLDEPTKSDLEPPPVPQVVARSAAVSDSNARHESAFSSRQIRAAGLALLLLLLVALLIWQRHALFEMLGRVLGADSQSPADTLSAEPEPLPTPPEATPSATEFTPPSQPASLPAGPASTPTQASAVPNTLMPPPNSDATPAGVPSVGVDEPVSGATYVFEAQRLCWVFARETTGKETKVTLKAGQRLSLPGRLAYLAIGDLAAVRVWVDGAERDLTPFSTDGRVTRLGPQELRAVQDGIDASIAPLPD